MTETGKLIHAIDSIEHDLKHLGYIRKEATGQLPIIIAAARAQLASSGGSLPAPSVLETLHANLTHRAEVFRDSHQSDHNLAVGKAIEIVSDCLRHAIEGKVENATSELPR
jgi:hypothetical protein